MPESPPETAGTEDNPKPFDSLKKDLSTSKGEAFFVETTSAGYGDGPSAAPTSRLARRSVSELTLQRHLKRSEMPSRKPYLPVAGFL